MHISALRRKNIRKINYETMKPENYEIITGEV